MRNMSIWAIVGKQPPWDFQHNLRIVARNISHCGMLWVNFRHHDLNLILKWRWEETFNGFNLIGSRLSEVLFWASHLAIRKEVVKNSTLQNCDPQIPVAFKSISQQSLGLRSVGGLSFCGAYTYGCRACSERDSNQRPYGFELWREVLTFEFWCVFLILYYKLIQFSIHRIKRGNFIHTLKIALRARKEGESMPINPQKPLHPAEETHFQNRQLRLARQSNASARPLSPLADRKRQSA